MTSETLKKVRAEAKSMTLAALREAHADAMAGWARATTSEAAQHFHDLAGEYAEAYQRAAFPRES